MDLRAHLDRAEAQLRSGPHSDRARLDAESLLLHLIEKNRAWLLTHLEDEFGGCVAIRYASLIDRRATGEPIQYITGETEFYGLPFRVTPDVLIPRPETEHLVERVVRLIPVFHPSPKGSFSVRRVRSFSYRKLQEPRDNPQLADWPPRILEIGTGSGAIAISIAHDWSEAAITSVDISSAALAVALDNAKRLGCADQIRFLQGDLLSPVAGESFEIIVSNPPYVPATDRATLSVEVRDHEPAQALFAGAGGLDIYRRLIPQAFSALVPKGYLLLEIGYGQSDAVRALLANAGFIAIEFTPDLQGIPRVVTARHP